MSDWTREATEDEVMEEVIRNVNRQTAEGIEHTNRVFRESGVPELDPETGRMALPSDSTWVPSPSGSPDPGLGGGYGGDPGFDQDPGFNLGYGGDPGFDQDPGFNLGYGGDPGFDQDPGFDLGYGGTAEYGGGEYYEDQGASEYGGGEYYEDQGAAEYGGDEGNVW